MGGMTVKNFIFRVGCVGSFILLVLASYAPAIAQHGTGLGGTFNDPAGGVITKVIVNRVGHRRPDKTRVAGNSSRTKLDEAVRFRSTGTQLKTREIANLIDAGNPQIFTILTTILQEYEKAASAAGHPNDLALSLSFFFATNASIYHNAGEPTDPQMIDLRDTIAEALVETKALNGVTDRQKQEMYETLVIFTGFAIATYQEGKLGGNAETVKVAQQLAAQNLLAVTGISADKIDFGAQGLSIDNGDMAANDPNGALNSSKPAEPVAVAQSSPDTATMSIHAGKLVMEFEGNEVRANQIYGGKRVRVNGTVNSIEVQKNGLIVLTFHSPAGGYAQTQCYFNKSQTSRLAQFNGGQEAIVEGTVRGIGGGLGGRAFVILEDCVVP
jgi:hypothetical protein